MLINSSGVSAMIVALIISLTANRFYSGAFRIFEMIFMRLDSMPPEWALPIFFRCCFKI